MSYVVYINVQLMTINVGKHWTGSMQFLVGHAFSISHIGIEYRWHCYILSVMLYAVVELKHVTTNEPHEVWEIRSCSLVSDIPQHAALINYNKQNCTFTSIQYSIRLAKYMLPIITCTLNFLPPFFVCLVSSTSNLAAFPLTLG